MTRAEWRTYYESLRLEQDYPGIQGYGFSLWIRPQEKASIVGRLSAKGVTTFDVTPAGERSEYTSIIHLEPVRRPKLARVRLPHVV